MRNMKNSPLLRLVVLPLTLVTFLSACHKHVEIQPPYAAALAGRDVDARVTTVGRAPQIMEAIRVEGDSLVGSRWHGADKRRERIVLPLDKVQKIEQRKTDVFGTIGVGVLVLGGISAAAYAIECSSNPDSFFC